MMFFILGLNFSEESPPSIYHLQTCYHEELPQLDTGKYKIESAMALAPYKELQSFIIRSDFTEEVVDSMHKLP